MKAWRKWSRKR